MNNFIADNFAAVDTPTVLIDTDIVAANIARAADLCRRHNIHFRPHIKTHKIPAFAHQQMQHGAVGITCQKIGEAEVMADAGLHDILLTYNIVGEHKLTRLRRLATQLQNMPGRLQVTADNESVVAGLSAAFAGAPAPLSVLVECDTGAARCGVQTPAAAAQLAATIAGAEMPGVVFGGLMTYPPPHQIESVTAWLRDAVAQCRAIGLECRTVSSGGTPDLPTPATIAAPSVITEYRAGTYIYNDRAMVAHGSCTLADCAMTILTTVVSTPAPGRAIVDAGSKVLSSDLLNRSDYGEALHHPGIRVAALSEEHGHLTLPPNPPLRIGQRLRLIPNHACTVSNLADQILTIRQNTPAESHPVAARARTT